MSKIDLSDIQQMIQKLEALPAQMEYIVGLGAQYERLNHTYQNRTGNLERSTQAVWVNKSSKEYRMQLEMGMQYASYVRALGYSRIDDAAMRVRDALQEYCNDIVGIR